MDYKAILNDNVYTALSSDLGYTYGMEGNKSAVVPVNKIEKQVATNSLAFDSNARYFRGGFTTEIKNENNTTLENYMASNSLTDGDNKNIFPIKVPKGEKEFDLHNMKFENSEQDFKDKIKELATTKFKVESMNEMTSKDAFIKKEHPFIKEELDIKWHEGTEDVKNENLSLEEYVDSSLLQLTASCRYKQMETNIEEKNTRAMRTSIKSSKRKKCNKHELSKKFVVNTDKITPAKIHYGEDIYKCEHCAYSTHYLKNLIKTHLKMHAGRRPYKCEHCSYSAYRFETLKHHLRTHMGIKPYKCENCTYSTYNIYSLKYHLLKHTGIKPYKCEHCAYSANCLDNLKRHLPIHAGVKPYKCTLCECCFYRPESVKRHLSYHTHKKPYKCEQCEFRCNRFSSLKRHQSIHSDEKLFKCEHCEYRSNRTTSVKYHARIHSEEKPYKCEVCGYIARQLGTLKYHMRIHTNEKPYKCIFCEYRAAQRTSLKKHVQYYHLNKKLCHVCGLVFNVLKDLNVHMKIHKRVKKLS